MRQALVKVYAAFHPADNACLEAVAPAGQNALGNEDWLSLERGMLRISFEGLCFPLDDTLRALESCLGADASGKLDYLDLESWELTRCEYPAQNGRTGFTRSSRGLNHVLAYSGH
jgi:hypothetical protein